MLGLESVKDAEGNVIHEAPVPILGEFRQRALECRSSRDHLSNDQSTGEWSC